MFHDSNPLVPLAAWLAVAAMLIPAVQSEPPTYNVVVWGRSGRPAVHEAATLAARVISSSDDYSFKMNVTSVQFSDDNKPNEVFHAYRRTRQTSDQLVGIVGPPFSSQLMGAGIACVDDIPVLSVTATASNVFQDSARSLRSLVRVVPSDATSILALAAMILHYGWQTVGIVRDDSTYAASMSSQLDVATGLGVLVRDSVCETEKDCSVAVQELHDDFHVNVFIVWAQVPVTRTILSVARRLDLLRPGKAWIGNRLLGEVLGDMEQGARAAFSGVVEISSEAAGLEAETKLRTTWLTESPETFPISGRMPHEASLSWDAVFALARAVKVQNATTFEGASAGSPGDAWAHGASVVESIRAVSFGGASGRVTFDEYNARRLGSYRMRVWNGQDSWTTALLFSRIGPSIDQGVRAAKISVTTAKAISVTELAQPLWPGDTTAIPDGSGLTGLTLRVTVGHYPPYSIYDGETGTFSGFGIDILRQAAEKYAMRLEFSFWGVGGSSSMIHDVTTAGNATGTILDIGAKGFAIDGERFPDPNMYSFPFAEYQLRLVVPRRTPAVVKPLFGFAGPFSWGVWVAILGTVLLSAALLYVFESGSAIKKGRSGGLAALYDRCNACVGSDGAMVDESKITSSSAKLLIFSTRWFAMVLLSSYTALLAANLVAVSWQGGITSWEDVAYARMGTNGGGLSELITRRYANNVKLVQKGKDYSSRTEMLLDVVDGKLDAMALHPVIANYLINHDERLCGLQVIGEPKGTLPTAFVFRPDLNLAARRAVDETITNLRSQYGRPLRKLVDTYIAGGSVCHASADEQAQNTKGSYELDDFSGLFIVFYSCMLCVGVPLHFYEKCRKRGRFKVRANGPEKMANSSEKSIELRSLGTAERQPPSSTAVLNPARLSVLLKH